MQLLLWMSVFLIAFLDARNVVKPVTMKGLPSGLPDGSILTIFFKHKGNNDNPESVYIDFYDLPMVEMDHVYDVPAHLRIDRDEMFPVESNSYVNGVWLNHTKREQPLDEMPPSNGFWRVDVYKHDEYHMNVFFQGFWSAVREFKQSLNGLKSVYVLSDFVNHLSVQIRLKTPSYVPPMSVDEFKTNMYSKEDRRLMSFPAFPVGSHIELTVVLRASGGAKYDQPAILFVPDTPRKHWNNYFLKIVQQWHDGTEKMYIGSDFVHNPWHIRCGSEKPHGDLQHLRLERTAGDKVAMQLFYGRSTGPKGVVCEYTIPEEFVADLDLPFSFVSHDGALILHMDHSIPRSIEVQKDLKRVTYF